MNTSKCSPSTIGCMSLGTVYVSNLILRRFPLDALVVILHRHLSGDWGIISDALREQNLRLMADWRNRRIESRYELDRGTCRVVSNTDDSARTFTTLSIILQSTN